MKDKSSSTSRKQKTKTKKTPTPVYSPFDYNKDGKVDIAEQWIAYKIFQDITKEKKGN